MRLYVQQQKNNMKNKQKIVRFPDGFLRQPTIDVEITVPPSKHIKRLILNMIGTMFKKRALGLAANQLGRSERIIVIDARICANIALRRECEQNSGALVLINPIIHELSGDTVMGPEGCLSFPEMEVDVPRSSRIIVDALDVYGQPLRIDADLAQDDYLSRVLQHEIDHLEGKLMIDYVDLTLPDDK